MSLKIEAVAPFNHQPTLKWSLLAATALCENSSWENTTGGNAF
jgi:hypothetical protein